ncbi:hypothetical protein HXX76_003746 [Chlamydomonas incerta]|uniref:Membrane transporter protein n=1 Tax=Chlamydomonas incerta TaxID=51695 RepID=A0A835W529_CHLIN|nr:hypothetical protein HXX76_003746 [Chlamydomonas incerta]|eukprot:KAG2440892.1 hypothetical protein HXX76_003746 [Chlamydomonas incerta]
MAVVLLLVIALHVKLHEKAAKVFREWREKRRSAATYGLLEEEKAARRAGSSRAADGHQLASAPGSASDAALTGSLGSLADTELPSAGASGSDDVLRSLAVDCLPSPMPSRLPSLQAPGALTEALARNSNSGGGPRADGAAAGGERSSGSGHGSGAGGDECACGRSSSGGGGGGGHTVVVVVGAYCAPSAADVAAESSGTGASKPAAEGGAGAAGSGQGARAAEAAGSTGTDAPDVGAEMAGLLTISDMAPLLEAGAAASDANDNGAGCRCVSSCSACGGTGKAAASGGRCSSCGGGGGGGGRGRLLARLRHWVATADWREMRRIVAFGSVAGFTSGVMGGMTGIGGPPIMFMYERLQVAKDVVRGTNAVNNVLQPRLVTYIVMGLFVAADAPLYAVTSLVGLAGVALGNVLAGRLDQRGFSRVLVGLMLVCCALLFASAAGLKGHHAPPPAVAGAGAGTGGAGAAAAAGAAGAHGVR